jgi:hypothetical protein
VNVKEDLSVQMWKWLANYEAEVHPDIILKFNSHFEEKTTRLHYKD